MCEVADEMGLDVGACLLGTGLAESDLTDATVRLTLRQEIKAIENFVSLAPRRAGIGVEVGKRFHVNAFGIWGFAILTSPTVRASIETAIEFTKLSFVIADMFLEEAGEEYRLRFDMSALPDAIRAYVLERHCYIALLFFGEYLQEWQYEEFRIETTLDDLTYSAQLAEILKIDVTAGSESDALCFPASIIDGPLKKFDPVTLKFCLDQCRDLLEDLDGSLPPWSSKIRDMVLEDIGKECKIEEMASRLSITDRTLRRRLADEGTTFREVYTNARLTIAQQLLKTAGLTVETVSWRVGYSEPASFVRAFSRKFGVTPGSVRAD